MRQLVQPRRQRFELSVFCDGKLQDSWALGGGGRHIAVRLEAGALVCASGLCVRRVVFGGFLKTQSPRTFLSYVHAKEVHLVALHEYK